MPNQVPALTLARQLKYFSFGAFIYVLGGCVVWGGIVLGVVIALFSIAEWTLRMVTQNWSAAIELPEYAGPFAAVICFVVPGAFIATICFGQVSDLQEQLRAARGKA